MLSAGQKTQLIELISAGLISRDAVNPVMTKEKLEGIISTTPMNATTNKKENNMKNILFIAPSRTYAMTVYRNLQKDLARNNVTAVPKEYSHKLEVNTAKVTVNIHWWDPVAWTLDDFRDFDALFGKKELVEKVRTTFVEFLFKCPKQPLYKWIVEQNCGEEKEASAPRTQYIPAIKKVHFNDPVTVVLWEDGTKTVVQCQDGDIYSRETGLALCISKKAFGNKGNFNEVFKKWIPEEKCSETVVDVYPEYRMPEEIANAVKEAVADMFRRHTKRGLL